MNKKRVDNILDMYSGYGYQINPISTGGFSLSTSDNVYLGFYADYEKAVYAIPVITFNSKRGYVPAKLIEKKKFIKKRK